MAMNKGLKPTVSETAPISNVNRKLAIQALEPRALLLLGDSLPSAQMAAAAARGGCG